MDYIETFAKLSPNTKYARKSPHKAILLLAVIDMYESQLLSNNEIRYNEKLINTYTKIWNTVQPGKAALFSEAYVPYWYMENENFWHVVPRKGKKDILTLLRDPTVTPSESKLADSIDYAELDEDLYFLMTLSSGRSSLKRVLLENHTSLPQIQIEKLSSSLDTFTDQSISAIEHYRKILSDNSSTSSGSEDSVNHNLQHPLCTMCEDVQYAINIEYYTFLKKNTAERVLIKEICPDVFSLFERITTHPVKQSEISRSAALAYENFLSNLRIALMGEDCTLNLVDKIQEAIKCLHEEDHSQELYAIRLKDTSYNPE